MEAVKQHDSEATVAMTPHESMVGRFFPRRKRTEAELAAFDAAAAAWQAEMDRAGLTEEDLLQDIENLRKSQQL